MRNLKYFIAAPLFASGLAALYSLAANLAEKPSPALEHWQADDWLAGFFATILLTTGFSLFVLLHRRTAGLVSGKTLARLREKGRPARADILELADTGMTVDDDPVVQATLLIHHDARPPYQVRIKQTLGRLAAQQLAAGGTTAALVDPDDPNTVALNL